MRILIALFALLVAFPALAAPAMWRVSKGDSEVILFGTLHELPKDTVWRTPRIFDRIDAAQAVVVEIDLPEDPYIIAAVVQKVGVRPGLPPLLLRVSPANRDKLTAAVTGAKLPMAALDNMKTWLAAITLSNAVVGNAGYSAQDGVDATITAYAHVKNKPIVPLETVEQQLGYFDVLPEADQRALIEATLDEMATTKVDTDKLVAGWLAGDTAAIIDDFDKEMRSTPGLFDVLVTQRNTRWADWIAGVLAKPGKLFVAVGAGHLAGPGSLPELLAARGFTVERLP
jgi:uncharacterized protein YbaP (TraB family)